MYVLEIEHAYCGLKDSEEVVKDREGWVFQYNLGWDYSCSLQ